MRICDYMCVILCRTNPAGYMTKDGFKDLLRLLLKLIPEDQRPCIIILDGHDSHMIPDVWLELYDNGIYLIIIPSHTSGWLGVNDVGPNSRL